MAAPSIKNLLALDKQQATKRSLIEANLTTDPTCAQPSNHVTVLPKPFLV
jgi:hypothetical protein